MAALSSRFFEDVVVGEPLPPLEFEISMTALVMYAGATWDFHPYHYDAAYVTQRGMRFPFMDGQMIGALLARQLMSWGGPDAFVRRLNYRLRAMVYAGERILVSGEVTGTTIESGCSLALCKINVVKTDGTEIVRDAAAAIELMRR